jgi:hypothetical protein
MFGKPCHSDIGGDSAGLRAGLERLSAALDEFSKR